MFKFLALLLCCCSFLSAKNHVEEIKTLRYMYEKNYQSTCEAIDYNYVSESGHQILVDQKNHLDGCLEAFDICIKILEK